MGVIGYYVTCDDAMCANCAPDGFADGDYTDWSGFEGWTEPIAIFDDSESDSTTFCKVCESLIPQTLTSVGIADLVERMTETVKDAKDGGRRCILRQVWEQYSADVDESDLRAILAAFVATFPRSDQYSPKTD
jgi:hypothetical protein